MTIIQSTLQVIAMHPAVFAILKPPVKSKSFPTKTGPRIEPIPLAVYWEITLRLAYFKETKAELVEIKMYACVHYWKQS